MGFYTSAQASEPAFGTAKVKPQPSAEHEAVGTVVFNNEVVLDDVDRYPTFLLFTPAAHAAVQLTGTGWCYSVHTDSGSEDGSRGVSAVELEIVAALPKGTTYSFHVTSVVEGQVDRTVKPEAIALAVFGVIALLAALLIALQMIARQLRARDEENEVLRALGASPCDARWATVCSAFLAPSFSGRCWRSAWRLRFRPSRRSVRCVRSIPHLGSRLTRRCSASGCSSSSAASGSEPSRSRTGQAPGRASSRGTHTRRARFEPGALGCELRCTGIRRCRCPLRASNRAAAAPQCRCAQRCSAPCSQ